MAPRTFRTRLDFRRLSSPPDDPPEGSERLYADASGAIRQRDDEGNDATLGGDSAPSAISDIEGLQDALDALAATAASAGQVR